MIKGVLLLGLLLLVLLAGLPLVMAMGPMPPCPECSLTPGGMLAMCFAILGLLTLLVPASASRLTRNRELFRLLLGPAPPERPPRV